MAEPIRIPALGSPINKMMFMGAGALDTSTPETLLRDTFGGAHTIEGPVRPLVDAILAGDRTAGEQLAAPVVAAGAGIPNGIGSMGNCMFPAIRDGEVAEVDPNEPIAPGDLAVIVVRLGFTMKLAMYLGRLPTGPYQPIEQYRADQPGSLFVFFQRSPIVLIVVADRDMVALRKVARIHGGEGGRVPGHWSHDVRKHPDLADYFDEMDGQPVAPIGADLFAASNAEAEAFAAMLSGKAGI